MESSPRISRMTLAESAAEALRQMIKSGEIPLGAALRQEELAARLGISRTPLREAIGRLDAEGLVVNDPHRGAVVYRPTVEDLVESFEILEELEALACRLAARNWQGNDLAELSAILDGYANVLDSDGWRVHNEQFHFRLYSVAQRPQLLNLIVDRFKRTTVFLYILIQGKRETSRSNKEHHQMLAALESRDEETLERLIRAHVRAVVAYVSSHL